MNIKNSAVGFTASLLLVLLIFYWPFLSGAQTFYYTDASFYLEPHCRFIVEALKQGSLPLWNPLNYCGMPQIAVTFPSFLYPPTLLFAIMPFSQALALNMVLHQALAGLGMLLLLRSFRWSLLPSITGALAYGLSGYMFALSSNHTLVAGAAWIPLLLYFIKALEGAAPERFFSLSLGGAFSIFMLIASGRPEVFVPGLFLAGLFVLVSIILRRQEKTDPFPSSFIWQVRSMVLGLLLALPVLLPAAEWLSVSRRAVGLTSKEVFYYSASFYDLLTMVVGPFMGDLRLHGASFRNVFLSDLTVPYLSCAYLGPVVLTLAFWGALDRRWRFALPVVFLTAVGLLGALGKSTPVMPALVEAFPALGFVRFPVKLLFIPSMGLAVLAARGLYTFDADSSKRQKRSAIYSAVLWLLAGGGCLALRGGGGSAVVGPVFEQALCQALLISSFVGLLISGIGYGAAQKLIKKQLACLLFSAGLALSLLASAFLHERDGAAADFYNEPSFAMQFLARNGYDGRSRILDLFLERLTVPPSYLGDNQRIATHRVYQYNRQILKSDTNLDFGVPSSYGFEGTMRGDYYHTFLESYFKSSQSLQERSEPVSDLPLARFCRLTATRYVLTQVYRHIEKDVPVPLLDQQNFKLLAEDGAMNLRLYEVRGALDRAYLSQATSDIESRNKAIDAILDPASGFDPAAATLVEGGGEAPGAPDAERSMRKSIEWTESTSTRIVLAVKAKSPGFLVLADQDYPGWRASLDGAPARILTANGFTRAVSIPQAGDHEVVFEYHPDSFYLGLALAGLGLLLVPYLYFRSRKELE
ncbi:MAG: hypothetical protein AB7W16_22740 [Candidatus Obscuribacterales bacterium]